MFDLLVDLYGVECTLVLQTDTNNIELKAKIGSIVEDSISFALSNIYNPYTATITVLESQVTTFNQDKINNKLVYTIIVSGFKSPISEETQS